LVWRSGEFENREQWWRLRQADRRPVGLWWGIDGQSMLGAAVGLQNVKDLTKKWTTEFGPNSGPQSPIRGPMGLGAGIGAKSCGQFCGQICNQIPIICGEFVVNPSSRPMAAPKIDVRYFQNLPPSNTLIFVIACCIVDNFHPFK